MRNNTINTMILDFSCRSEATAKRFENEFVNYKLSAVTTLLSKLLDEIHIGSGEWIIDKLEINIGTLHIEDVANDHLLNLFQKKFLEQITEISNRGKQQTESESQDRHVSVSVLEHYLETGDLPWWIEKTGFAGIGSMLRELIQKNPDMVFETLKRFSSDAGAVYRLRNIGSPPLNKILGQLLPEIMHYEKVTFATLPESQQTFKEMKLAPDTASYSSSLSANVHVRRLLIRDLLNNHFDLVLAQLKRTLKSDTLNSGSDGAVQRDNMDLKEKLNTILINLSENEFETILHLSLKSGHHASRDIARDELNAITITNKVIKKEEHITTGQQVLPESSNLPLAPSYRDYKKTSQQDHRTNIG